MRTKYLLPLFLAALTAIPAQSDSTSQQQTATEPSPAVKDLQAKVKVMETQCKDDVEKLCKGQPQQEVAACLYNQRANVDQQCKDAIASADASAQVIVDRVNVEFRKACGQDVQKYCSEVPQGGGRILECLSLQSPDSISSSCRTFQAKVKQQIEAIERSS